MIDTMDPTVQMPEWLVYRKLTTSLHGAHRRYTGLIQGVIKNWGKCPIGEIFGRRHKVRRKSSVAALIIRMVKTERKIRSWLMAAKPVFFNTSCLNP
jgi:hypothetical protein